MRNIKALRLKYKAVNPKVVLGLSRDREMDEESRTGLIRDHLEENAIGLDEEDLIWLVGRIENNPKINSIRKWISARIRWLKPQAEEQKSKSEFLDSRPQHYSTDLRTRQYNRLDYFEGRIQKLEALRNSLS